MDRSDPKRRGPGANAVLVIKLGALGDILLADGALRDIRHAHPDAHVAVLTRRAFVPLLSRCPWIDWVIGDDHAPRWRIDRMWRLGRMLRAYRFSRIYDLQNSRRSHFYLQRLLTHVCASSAYRYCALPVSHPNPKSLPVPERHAAQLADAGIQVRHTMQPQPTWTRINVDELLLKAAIDEPFVVLLPGASKRHARKRWPHYAELSRHLDANGLRVVTIPGPDEADLGAGFAGTVLRVDGRPLDIFELAGVLDRAAFVVGNDSGPTHLAALLGRPALPLLGSNHANAYMTRMDKRMIHVIEAARMEDISLEEVLRASESIIRRALHEPRASARSDAALVPG